jgi:GxxExxY protein
MNLLFGKEVYEIIGASMEVHNELGPGFLESVYQEALEREFILRQMPYEREKLLNVFYKGIMLSKKFSADFLCYNHIIVETKAESELNSKDEAQVLNYLKTTKLKIGLLINFGSLSLEYKRIIH